MTCERVVGGGKWEVGIGNWELGKEERGKIR